MVDRDETDERLERLLAATSGASARGDFASRVMGAVEREPAASGFWIDLPRVARVVVPFAAVAAVASVVWALRATRDADDAALAAHDSAEQSVVFTLDPGESE